MDADGQELQLAEMVDELVKSGRERKLIIAYIAENYGISIR